MKQPFGAIFSLILLFSIPAIGSVEDTPIGFIQREPGGISITSNQIPYEFIGSAGTSLPVEWQPLAADFDGDGWLDVCLPQMTGTFDDANEELVEMAGPILIGFGDGTGAIEQFSKIADECLPGYLAHGDLNEDNRVDVVTLLCDGTECQLVIWYGSQTRAFERKVEIQLPGVVHNIQVFDADNDGHLDLFALVGTEEVIVQAWVLRGDGQGNYEEPIRSSTGLLFIAPEPKAEIGDINGDNIKDVVLVGQSILNGWVHSLVVAYGDGKGSFTFEKGERVLIYPRFMALGDINGDGVNDICIGHLFDEWIDPETGELRIGEYESTKATVFLGSSPNGLLPGRIYEVGIRPKRVFLEDIDADGFADAVFVNQEAIVIVMAGSSEGFLDPPSAYSAANGSHSQCWSSGMGDLNDDGSIDLFAQLFDQELVVRFGNERGGFGTGWMAPPISTNLPIYASALAGPADFDLDGHLDLVFFDGGGTGIAFGDGTGEFSEMIVLLEGYWWESAGIGDFNGDGHEDVIFGRSRDKEGSELRLFLNFGSRSFKELESTIIPQPDEVNDLVADDVDADGYCDVLVCDWTDKSFILHGNHNSKLVQGTTIMLPKGLLASSKQEPSDIGMFTPVLLDIDNDAHLDLVAISRFDGERRGIVWLGIGNGMLVAQDEYPIGNISSRPVDINGDGYLDLIASQVDVGSFTLYGQPDGTFKLEEINTAPHADSVGDLDGDGNVDFAEAWGGVLWIYLGDGHGGREPRLQFAPHALGYFSYGLDPISGDFNEDGRLDIALSSDYQISIIMNQFPVNGKE